ncbi:MAG TPA: T9SS type A sorting domain-containing protein, partial [Chryseolinea sp.]|nr:T9SS type A sorting domain-containing protein [Chryseolinea sp.]
IERAKDAGNWDSLTTLKGRGNSASTIQYSYIDQTPLKGKSYYRIRQVDNDNKFQYTKTLAVQDDCGDKQLIKIYPNPARESVQVVLPGSGEQATILVYDIAGRQIFPTIQTNDNAKTINTSGIPGGTYFLKITSGGKVFTRGLTIGK